MAVDTDTPPGENQTQLDNITAGDINTSHDITDSNQISLDDSLVAPPFVHTYDMTLDEFLDDGSRTVDISLDARRQEDVKPIQIQVPMFIWHTAMAVSRSHRISKTKVYANALKLGLAIWQHITAEEFNQTKDFHDRLYYTNYPACARIFSINHLIPVAGRGEVQRRAVNVFAEVDPTLPAISDQSDFLGISQSEFITCLLTIAFVRWGDIPQQVRSESTGLICLLSKRQQDIIRACTHVSGSISTT